MRQKTIIMLDIETAATKPNAVILSIGAVCGEFHTGRILASFYQNIDVDSSIKKGLVTSKKTLEWWSRQSEKAIKSLEHDQIDIEKACKKFLVWCHGPARKGKTLWAKGPDFDNVILKSSFEAVNVRFPLSFITSRDVRTLIDVDFRGARKKIKNTGEVHNALDDAMYQFKYCSAIWRDISI